MVLCFALLRCRGLLFGSCSAVAALLVLSVAMTTEEYSSLSLSCSRLMLTLAFPFLTYLFENRPHQDPQSGKWGCSTSYISCAQHNCVMPCQQPCISLIVLPSLSSSLFRVNTLSECILHPLPILLRRRSSKRSGKAICRPRGIAFPPSLVMSWCR